MITDFTPAGEEANPDENGENEEMDDDGRPWWSLKRATRTIQTIQTTRMSTERSCESWRSESEDDSEDDGDDTKEEEKIQRLDDNDGEQEKNDEEEHVIIRPSEIDVLFAAFNFQRFFCFFTAATTEEEKKTNSTKCPKSPRRLCSVSAR